MKAIVILLDSLNRHDLPVYGNNRVQTPNITRLARRSVVFDNHWLGSAPCMPARRDMLTGRLGFLERGWGGMEPFDIPLPRVLSATNTHCHMETDHYHYAQCGGENYHTGFTTWGFHRGQEYDAMPTPIDPTEKIDPRVIWNKAQYDRNRAFFRDDADFPTPRTFAGAIRWLDMNRQADNYLLWVEAFDPHVPYDVTLEFLRLYADDLKEDGEIWMGSELGELRARYAAAITMADRWLGKLLDQLERQSTLDDTLIILTADHGELHGEHGLRGKNACHAYNELAHLPLIVHLPGNRNAGERRAQLTQNVDLFPTLAEYFGSSFEHPIHGSSFFDIASKNAATRHTSALYGWYGKTANITDGRFTLFQPPARRENDPLFQYFLTPTGYHRLFEAGVFRHAELGMFLPHAGVPVLRTLGPPRGEFGFHDELFDGRLYDLTADYPQERNLWASEPRERARMQALLIAEMQRVDAPEEQYVRLGLR